MNTKEHVMVCGAEEAGEVAVAALAVQKALCKMMRFGKDDVNPERDLTAAQVLVVELNDLRGGGDRTVAGRRGGASSICYSC